MSFHLNFDPLRGDRHLGVSVSGGYPAWQGDGTCLSTKFRFHDLRHNWASWHVMSRTSLQELMELGGWKSYEMVLRYAHLTPEHLAGAAARIERRWENVAEHSTIFSTLETTRAHTEM